jgi:hypothetical protein
MIDIMAQGACAPHRQKGFLLIAAVILIAVLAAFFTVSFTFFFASNTVSGLNHTQSAQALYVAESGSERGTRALLSPILDPANSDHRVACGSVSGDTNLTNIAIGKGEFTITAIGPSYSTTATTLNGALTAAATTITVNDATSYASRGRIMIDRELINYSSTTGTTFEGAVRGVDGTIATTHANGTPVGQDQCDLTSVGGVPNTTNPNGLRRLSQGVQLQEGWAVGVFGGSAALRPLFLRFDGTTWNTFDSTALNISRQLNSVSMLSYADGWAVGLDGPVATDSPLILWWNGTTWALRNSSLNINQDLNSVYCVSTNDCWTVGIAGAGATQRPFILWWNGATWALRNSSLNVNLDLNSVYCVSTNDCWTVGTAGAGATQRPFILWWNGTTWALRNSSLNINATLNSIHCAATNDCWAVGDPSAGELILHWDGTTWSRTPPVAAIPDVILRSVYCVSGNDCWIVGDMGSTRLHWDGAAWSLVTAPVLTQNLRSIYVIGPNRWPQSFWREVFP